jgi:hypothetical protein
MPPSLMGLSYRSRHNRLPTPPPKREHGVIHYSRRVQTAQCYRCPQVIGNWAEAQEAQTGYAGRGSAALKRNDLRHIADVLQYGNGRGGCGDYRARRRDPDRPAASGAVSSAAMGVSGRRRQRADRRAVEFSLQEIICSEVAASGQRIPPEASFRRESCRLRAPRVPHARRCGRTTQYWSSSARSEVALRERNRLRVR